MKRIFNILKGLLFIFLGVILILTPYSRFKETFPGAPAPLLIKVLGGIIVLCGAVILAALFINKK